MSTSRNIPRLRQQNPPKPRKQVAAHPKLLARRGEEFCPAMWTACRRSTMKRLTLWDVIYALNMAVACTISYALVTGLFGKFIVQADSLLGGMWAAVATLFVFRETREETVSAGISRLIA